MAETNGPNCWKSHVVLSSGSIVRLADAEACDGHVGS
jgi:hypothetical protein